MPAGRAIGLGPLRWHLLECLVLGGVAVAADAVDHHQVLGLPGDATSLQTHLAYVNLTKSFDPQRRSTLEERRKLAEVQQAFEALTDAAGKEEALSVVNYWEHVRQLEDDEDLQRFTEFQTNGSAHLRIVFVIEQPGQRHWGVFAAATRLHGRARVAQLCPADAAGGRFITSFRLRQYPAAVIYDPVSRGMRVAYGIDGVAEDTQKLLDGALSSGDRVARVQELDAELHTVRCGAGAAEPCAWTLALVTSSGLEARRDSLPSALRPFVDACQRLHMPSAPCFWLRLGRAPQWEALLRRQGVGAADDLALVAIRQEGSGAVAVAPPGKASRGADDIAAWLREAIEGRLEPTEAVLPPFPEAVAIDEEPAEEALQMLLRKLKRYVNQAQGELDQLLAKAEGKLMKMDTEEKTMLAGVVLCSVMLFGVLFRQCCCCCGCGRRAPKLTEDEAVRQISPVLAVQLRRGGGEKLGLGIAPTSQGGFTITGVYEGTLVDKWNMAQQVAELRVRKGDRIVSVTSYPASNGSKCVVASSTEAIQDALKSGDDVCLSVAAPRSEQEVQCVAATVCLEGLSLDKVAELCAPARSCGGPQKDALALEIATLHPALAQFNEARRAQGACCLQQLQVGDRVVSVNGSLDVRSNMGAASPTLVVARWRPAGALRAERFRVEIQRLGPEDRLGMQIGPQPGGASDQLEVLEVVPSGAIDRWNATPGNRRILKGDRIVGVNGQSKDLRGQLASMQVAIDFERWVDDSNGAALFPASNGGAPLPSASPLPPPTVAASPAPQRASPTPQDATSQASIFFPWHMLVLALVVSFSVFGDQPMLQRAMQAVQALESCAALVRQGLLGVHPKDQGAVALALLSVGCLLALWFLSYEVRMIAKPSQRRTLSQLLVAACASTLLGVGNFSLLTWAGVEA